MYLVKTRADGFASLKDDEYSLSQILIFPNPCSGICNLSLKKNYNTPISLQIFDLNGKMIYRKDNLFFSSLKETIDLNALEPGMYFLNFSGDDIHESSKLLIQK